MKKKLLSITPVRIYITIIWIVLIGLFLYMGNMLDYFRYEKNINILVWGAVLDKEFLVDFEKETGIQVNVNYFENNEELFVKLRSTEYHDYDLIMPSDWASQLLIKEGIVKKLDHSKINFLSDIYPALLNRYFDPGNEYTVPYYWTLYGLAVNKDYYKNQLPEPTWGLIFDEQLMPPYICVFEDIRPLSLIAAQYLFGYVEQLNHHQIELIKHALKIQKKHVEIYTDNRSEYVLASGATPIVAGLSGDFLKVMRRFDNFVFLIPKEGAFAIIDSFAIPSASKKDEQIYFFLNYLFRKNIVKAYVDKFEFFPAVQVPVEYDERFEQFIEPTEELFKNVHFFRNIMSSDVLNEILIALKS